MRESGKCFSIKIVCDAVPEHKILGDGYCTKGHTVLQKKSNLKNYMRLNMNRLIGPFTFETSIRIIHFPDTGFFTFGVLHIIQ
jgi:hypothetical protein